MSDKKSQIEEILKLVQELRAAALYGKKKHFNAADRKQNFDTWLGLPAIVINLIVGSLLFGLAAQQFPIFWGWVGAFLVLVSTILTATQTFFHFQRQVDGHRRVANHFLDIANECRRIEAYINAGMYAPDKVREQLEAVSRRYAQVNLDAETYPTSRDDYEKARKDFKEEESYTPQELNYKGE